MKKAFTLIELLVVIAIIAILAAILFPVFAQAKEAAKKTQDLSNCRQLGVAFLMYANDFDDYFPLSSFPVKENTWTTQVQPYIKNRAIYRSPSDASNNWPPASLPVTDPTFLNYRMSSYFLNAFMSGGYQSGKFANTSSIVGPASTIYIAQANDNIVRDHFHPFYWGTPSEETNGFMQNLTFDPATGLTKELKLTAFSGGQNYTYVDGHAKFGKWSQTWWRDLDRGIFAGNYDPRNEGRN